MVKLPDTYITPISCTLHFKTNIFIPISISLFSLTVLSEALHLSVETVLSQIIGPDLCGSHNPENALSVTGPHSTCIQDVLQTLLLHL